MKSAFPKEHRHAAALPRRFHARRNFQIRIAYFERQAHPLHYDFDYARAKGWDAPIAHGLLLLGLCALGAAPISRELTESMVAMLGNEARYKRPAFIGDTVTPQFTVVAVEPKGADRGIARLAITLHNQRNEVVLEGMHVLMLKRRASVK